MKDFQNLTHEDVLQRLQRVAAGGAVRCIDAALVLQCSLRTIRRMIAEGVLRVNRWRGRTAYIDRTCIENLIRVPLPFDPVDQAYLQARLSR